MKDEYDFRGGTRGRFFRPHSRVKLPYHRGSQSWLVDVAATGRWWHPEFWRDAEYLAASPWSAERVESAFNALIQVYTADVAIAAFRWVVTKDPSEHVRCMEHPLWRLLACPLRPDLSALLRLGLDIVDADAVSNNEIVHDLRSDNPTVVAHARFECRCLAAFRNAGVEALSHPTHPSGRQPDLAVRIPGGTLYIDTKRSGESERIKEEQAWFWKLATAHSDGANREIDAYFTLTKRYEELQNTDESRAYLRANIDRLASKLATTKERLAQADSAFPAFESVEGLVDVTVLGATSRRSGGSFLGVPTDGRREVARIVQSVITCGASYLPPDEPGLVFLDPGTHAPSHLLVEEVTRWMAAEGATCRYLVGVMIAVETLVEPAPGVIGRVEQLVPVWRDAIPSWITSGPWDAVSRAFALRDLEVLAHRLATATDANHMDAAAG